MVVLIVIASPPCYAQAIIQVHIDLGDDIGPWANNSVCDDARFEGRGVDEVLAPEDIGKDASDCRLVIESGLARLRAVYLAFGDDSGDWALDGQCDDPRFSFAQGVREVSLGEDVANDATDCYSAYNSQEITANILLK